jgi:hypothetical protein
MAFAGEGLRESRRRRRLFLAGSASLALLLLGWIAFSGIFRVRRLSVITSPTGARIFLDDAELGISPLRDVRIPRKGRILRLEKPGFQSLEHGLRGEDRALELNLVPKPLELAIASDPQGAEVFLNGAFKGLTPLPELKVPGEGNHRLLVKKSGFEPWAMTIGRDHRPPARVFLHRVAKGGARAKESGFWEGVKDRTKRLFGGKG